MLLALAALYLGTSGVVGVTGLTDSQVSSEVVSRGLTTAFPLCCVAMELAAQLEMRSAELRLEWVPRNMNEEADRLADGDARGFSSANKRGTEFADLRWLVLDDLLRTGAEFYQASAARTPARRKAATSARRRAARARLRDREPW